MTSAPQLVLTFLPNWFYSLNQNCLTLICQTDFPSRRLKPNSFFQCRQDRIKSVLSFLETDGQNPSLPLSHFPARLNPDTSWRGIFLRDSFCTKTILFC